jgi:hypothetical protein
MSEESGEGNHSSLAEMGAIGGKGLSNPLESVLFVTTAIPASRGTSSTLKPEFASTSFMRPEFTILLYKISFRGGAGGFYWLVKLVAYFFNCVGCKLGGSTRTFKVHLFKQCRSLLFTQHLRHKNIGEKASYCALLLHDAIFFGTPLESCIASLLKTRGLAD